MSQICSINFEENIKVGNVVKKGDMLGSFLFGGSDIIMIFQDRANFEMDKMNYDNATKYYKHLLMGEKYGILKNHTSTARHA